MKVDHGRLKRMGVEKEVVKEYKRKRKGGKMKSCAEIIICYTREMPPTSLEHLHHEITQIADSYSPKIGVKRVNKELCSAKIREIIYRLQKEIGLNITDGLGADVTDEFVNMLVYLLEDVIK